MLGLVPVRLVLPGPRAAVSALVVLRAVRVPLVAVPVLAPVVLRPREREAALRLRMVPWRAYLHRRGVLRSAVMF